MSTINTRIALKRDTKANWEAHNPVLYAGEVAFETDTTRFKVGDGTNTYTDLKYYYGVTEATVAPGTSNYNFNLTDLLSA